MYKRFQTYKPPRDGDPDSADPIFKSRKRPCGTCGGLFWTTGVRRYYCTRCWEKNRSRSPEVERVAVAGGNSYGFGGSKG